MTIYHSISSHIVGAMMHVAQENTDTSLILILILTLMPSHFHTQHQAQHRHHHHHHHHHHQCYTTSLLAPVRVCSPAIEAAIARHASPSFCIAVTDEGTGDGADEIDVVIDI